MKKPVAFGAAFLVLVVAAGSEAQDHRGHHGGDGTAATSSVSIGTEVKAIALKDSKGETIALETLRRTEKTKGKVVVLTFWCTSCSSCRQVERQFERKAKVYGEKGALFLAVDSNFTEDADRVNAFLAEKKLSFPVLMDSRSEIAGYFGAKVTTTTAVIDAEGRLRYYGAFGMAEDAIRDVLAGRVVAHPLGPEAG